MWRFLSGLEKVIYQMKILGFRLWRFTSESDVVAALTVPEGAGQEYDEGRIPIPNQPQ